jgi:hypothetical protein
MDLEATLSRIIPLDVHQGFEKTTEALSEVISGTVSTYRITYARFWKYARLRHPYHWASFIQVGKLASLDGQRLLSACATGDK